MLEIIITSSILIAVIFLIRLIFKGKISRVLQYSLWSIVMIRLLLPISMSAPISVMNVIDTAPLENIFINETINIVADSDSKPTVDESTTLIKPEQSAVATEKIDYVKLIWFTGIIVVAVWLLIVNLMFYIKLRKYRIKLDIKCKLDVYQADFIQSPCLFGIVKPAIYLKQDVLDDKEKTHHVIMHELCHYAHLDHIWSLVRVVCLSIYWFNPLVWCAAICSRSDCELACDELVIKRLGNNQSLDYANTLVSLIAVKSTANLVVQTATTMAYGKRAIKNRLNMIVKSPKTLIPSLIVVIVMIGTMVGCTFTGSTEGFTAENAITALSTSITYDSGQISFTIPKEYKKSNNWDIRIVGRIKTEGTDGMSVHLFEQETEEKTWQAGQTYNIKTDDSNYTDLAMNIVIEGNDEYIDLLEFIKQVEYNKVNIAFPVYENSFIEIDGQSKNVAEVDPFKVSLNLPKSWEIRKPTDADKNVIMGTFFSEMVITDGEKIIAGIGYNVFEPYVAAEGEEPMTQENYYKTVYPDLRLGSMVNWNPYVAVKTADNSETGIADVWFLDPDEIDNHPGAMSDVPVIETKGILAYDKEIGAYIGLMFQPESVTDEQIRTIADSVTLTKGDDTMSESISSNPDIKQKSSETEAKVEVKLIYPVDGKITSPFGKRIIGIGKDATEIIHNGIDIAAPEGSEIKAAADGTVLQSKWDYGYGNRVIIEHANGIQTSYAHCSKLIINAGEAVKQGDIIALVGTTGKSTGNHLGFEVTKDGVFIDPETMLK